MIRPARPSLAWDRWLRIVLGFVAVTALGGAISLVVLDGRDDLQPTALLAHTPFSTFTVPALALGLGVSGSSLAALVLVRRGTTAAVDAVILAGGVLAGWIAAEVAMMRVFHWLQGVYGFLGLLIVARGVVAALRSGVARHRWVVIVTAGETLGFLVPATIGVGLATAGASEALTTVLVCLAGFGEGTILGWAQASSFPFRVRRWRYAAWSGLGAFVAWAGAFALMAWVGGGGVESGELAGARVVIAACGGLVLLLALGAAQAVELRHHVDTVVPFVGWTTVAWLVALPISFAPMPFVDETTPPWVSAVLWALAGWGMAYVMALVTWQGARRLVAR